jgi:hypothetical protein
VKQKKKRRKKLLIPPPPPPPGGSSPNLFAIPTSTTKKLRLTISCRRRRSQSTEMIALRLQDFF